MAIPLEKLNDGNKDGWWYREIKETVSPPSTEHLFFLYVLNMIVQVLKGHIIRVLARDVRAHFQEFIDLFLDLGPILVFNIRGNFSVVLIIVHFRPGITNDLGIIEKTGNV